MTLRAFDNVIFVSAQEPLTSLVSSMKKADGRLVELVLVVGDYNALLGVINYGDIIRLLAAGGNLDGVAADVMITDPITAPAEASEEQILKTVRSQMIARTNGEKEFTKLVPLVDSSNVVIEISDIFELLIRSPRSGYSVEVYGLGFVGLTLSVALASRGHVVTAVDSNVELVEQLKDGKPHVHEPRLGDMLEQSLRDENLKIVSEAPNDHHRVVIIAVGTPVDQFGNVSLKALENVCRVVGKRLQSGDLVMPRSTIPVGTCRGLVKDILEAESGLTVGRDFHLVFAPERTVEGKAIQELTSLPQIVGGYSSKCVSVAVDFWQTLTSSVVKTDSLEAAELVKLVNNSYRDLSFAFSNGLALLSDKFNLPASRIIDAANEGYPRNQIPGPSPGVGGYCLTKDPFLYGAVDQNALHSRLATLGREINVAAGAYPFGLLCRFANVCGRPLKTLRVVVAGMAFKGLPETNDLRGSLGIELAHQLIDAGCDTTVFDAVADVTDQFSFQTISTDLLDSVKDCDAFFIMNNHPLNAPDGLLSQLSNGDALLFDGWNLLNRFEVERHGNITYSTMGYMTPNE